MQVVHKERTVARKIHFSSWENDKSLVQILEPTD